MRLLRATYVKIIFTFIAGVAFFNLSFVLAEFKLLDLKQTALVQNLINTGFEEETEHGSETSEGDASTKGVFEGAAAENLIHHQIMTAADQQREKAVESHAVKPGYIQIFSPPPEFSLTVA